MENGIKYILEVYKLVFEDLDKFPGEYKIRIKDICEELLNPLRRVPESIKSELRKSLD
ncbi:Hypothetical protein CINCED_3A024291 [Cinara cedri]|uniref:Uncharacterized protein n=1 Tax=Cinara cedri TaxID=506608 RepID=A0A5E4ML53_9HEMI|nr:Hypothetical protein CINCED_3A024291 [Cinara cedri]